MIEQEKVNKTRIWGYGLGIVVFVAILAWKLVTR